MKKTLTFLIGLLLCVNMAVAQKVIREKKYPIEITNVAVRPTYHENIEGADLKIEFVNRHKTKSIKHIYFTAIFTNKVYEYVMSNWNRNQDYNHTVKETGPIRPGESHTAIWEDVNYNKEAQRADLVGWIVVEYMDGTQVKLSALKYWNVQKEY